MQNYREYTVRNIVCENSCSDVRLDEKQAVAELGQTQVKLEDVDEVVVEARS